MDSRKGGRLCGVVVYPGVNQGVALLLCCGVRVMRSGGVAALRSLPWC